MYGFADSQPKMGLDMVYNLIEERIQAGLFGTGLLDQAVTDPAQLSAFTEQNRRRAVAECGTTDEPPAAS